jgi:hypothetical protein
MWLANENGFEPVSKVSSGRHLVDFTETPDGVMSSRQQLDGYRIVYQTDAEGQRLQAMQTFVQYRDTQFGVLCRAPLQVYPDYEELFLRVSHGIHILRESSAPFAGGGQQSTPAPIGEQRVPFGIEDLSELGGLSLGGYKIYQGLTLNSYSNGIDGSILILIDERLEGLKGEIQRNTYSQISTINIESDPKTWALEQGQVKQALLLVVDDRLRILYTEQLGRESARIDRVFLYENRRRPTFVLTRDYSIGMGSYNGPVSYFLEVSAAGIRYIFPHGLMTSLKTAWAILERRLPVEIISQKCRPDFEKACGGDFKVIYERIYFDADSWKSDLRQEDGVWESERPLDPQEFDLKFVNRELS